MLVLTRKCGESICIGDDIEITFVITRRNCVKAMIKAPKEVRVERAELRNHRLKETKKT